MQLSLFQLFSRSTPKPEPAPPRKPAPSILTFLPEASRSVLQEYLRSREVTVRIVNNRHTKLGDFRSPVKGGLPVITINRTLHPHSFLITLIHELAHYDCYRKYVRPRPHGERWKQEFRRLMKPLLTPEVFPESILQPLIRYMADPGASTSRDPLLTAALQGSDPSERGILLADVPESTVFSIYNGRKFRKGELLRKRYRCTCIRTGKKYLISGTIRITLHEN